MGPMAVKNCYPMQKLRAQPAQNASADPDGVRPQRSLLIVVNMLHTDASSTCLST